VVGQIIPWNFPILMATWKLAPALAAGNCVVLKPAEQTPRRHPGAAELIADLLPPGVLNIVNGFGCRGRQAAGLEQAHRQDRLHRRDHDRPADHAVRLSQNLIPVTLELGGKSPEHLLRRRDARGRRFFDKALEGFAMFALNQGEVCTCPSRALIQESIYDKFMERASSAPRRSSRATRSTRRR
jgi:aldehyde dehydrogenase